jgi:hypothetical protein
MAMTERQEKWFASAKASLEADTGRTLAQWAEIARACPETKQRAKLQWFKQTHGLGQNRASIVLSQLEGDSSGREDTEAALAALWSDPAARAIYDAVAAQALALPGTIVGARKAFTGFSRAFQFAALKPLKGGGALLGLDVTPNADPRLQPAKREGWSERLKSILVLGSPAEADPSVEALLRQAWTRAA